MMLSGTDKRVVSIWLPHFAVERHQRRSQPSESPGALNCVSPAKQASIPFVLTAPAQGGMRIMAADTAAMAIGIHTHQLLADARALYPGLVAAPYDPAGDEAALDKLAHAFMRYSPWVAPDQPDGLMLDISGCAHLFGGEVAMISEIQKRLHLWGLTPRIAAANTYGAAWAAAHYGTDALVSVTPDQTETVLQALPVAALRLSAHTVDRMAQVGLKHIGQLLPLACTAKERAPLAARFGPDVLTRLDQAVGRTRETLSPIMEAPSYRTSMNLMEPVQHIDAVAALLGDLITPMRDMLAEADLGAGLYRLWLMRVDGHVAAIDVRTSVHTRDEKLIKRLFGEKLKQFGEDYDAGFGIEALILGCFETEIIKKLQEEWVGSRKGDGLALQTLLDRYLNRFGPASVGRFQPRESYVPEQSEELVDVTKGAKQAQDWQPYMAGIEGADHLGRPIVLLPRPEEITAIAEVPDGPPVLFEWRQLKHRIIRAEGPERIAPEWWARPANHVEPTRDYYRVEDGSGYRYWLYRSGLYERSERPRWFMHGFFA